MIPTISEQKVQHLLETIKPVYHKDGKFWLIEIPDAFKIAYTWGPTLLEPIALTPLRKFRTLHRYGSPMLFKPSIAEVLAQWPSDLGDGVFYFTTKLGQTDAETLDKGFHVAETAVLKATA